MNDKNSIIEYYRKEICNTINQYTYKSGNHIKCAMDTWKVSMQKHIGVTPAMTSLEHAERIFLLGEHLRDIFYSTKTSASRQQGELSSGGYLWERLVAYYLNYCLANTRTVVFTGATNFEAIKTAVTFNDMDSTSEVDLLAITFPDKEEFSKDVHVLMDELKKSYPNQNTTPNGLEFIHNNRIRSEKKIVDNLANYYTKQFFSEFGLHVIQCKTNWNDSVQIPMLWSLLYYLSRDNVMLPISSKINFGSGLYTLPRLADFSYSFVSVPTQNNGEYETNPTKAAKNKIDFESKFSETNLPVQRAKLIRGGYYWGLPKYNSIFPVSELLNKNLSVGVNRHIVESIKDNIDSGRYQTDYDYFISL